jgi:nicotinate-nucleotide adenylyltransferase
MKLGLLGGTFDPIHLGHLRAAESAREALGLERVLLVPARVPPHRRAPIAPALDRFAMVALACAGHPELVASDLELQREGPSYTVDTVQALRRADPEAELFLLVGSDSLPEMPAWREQQRLFELCRVAVLPRPGAAPPADPRVLVVEGPALAVSATEIRARVAAGRSVRYLVPEPVADYIAKRGLFR